MEALFLQSIIDGISLGLIYALMAMGLSLAFGVMHIINVSHGEFVILGAFITYLLWSNMNINPLLAIPLIVVLTGTMGFLLQRYLVNRLIEAPPLSTLVFFFGLAIMLPNLYIMIWGPYSRSIVSSQLLASYEFLGLSISVNRVLVIALSSVSILTTLAVINKTKLGLAMRASAQDREAAVMMGVNIKNIYSLALSISLILAGLAGSLIAMMQAFTPVQGPVYTLLSFLIVVLGGMGYIYGSIVAGLLMGILQSLISTYLGSLYVYFLMFIILYVILIISPRGILRRGI